MEDISQKESTARSFKLKWENNPNLCLKETLDEGSEIFDWILRRNGFENSNELKSFLAGKRTILDAGCGNGRVTALLRKYSDPRTHIIGIDLVSHEIARKNLEGAPNVIFHRKDLLENLSDLGQFDYIYCQEVLHHTKDPKEGFENLCSLLTPDGEISVYVYKRKAPVREFVDDYIRARIGDLSYEKSMEVCKQITQLGRMLSECNLKIGVPSLDMLEIEEGIYDIQRFVYHFFMKCFWNSELSFEDNTAINYDWYHPQLCSRHTVEEVRQWFSAPGLTIKYEHVDFYGITMSGKKEPSR